MLIEVKVKVARIIDGKTGKRSETYVVDRELFSEAEYQVTAVLIQEQTDGFVDTLCRVAYVDEESHTQQQLVVDTFLEIDSLLTDHLSSKQTTTGRRRGKARGVEEVASNE